jgi:hypothetical protein
MLALARLLAYFSPCVILNFGGVYAQNLNSLARNIWEVKETAWVS